MKPNIINWHLLCITLASFCKAQTGYQYNQPSSKFSTGDIQNGFTKPVNDGFTQSPQNDYQSQSPNGYQYYRPAAAFSTPSPQSPTIGYPQPFKPNRDMSGSGSTPQDYYSYTTNTLIDTTTPALNTGNTGLGQFNGYPSTNKQNDFQMEGYTSVTPINSVYPSAPQNDITSPNQNGFTSLGTGNEAYARQVPSDLKDEQITALDNYSGMQGSRRANTGSTGNVGQSNVFSGSPGSPGSSSFITGRAGNLGSSGPLSGSVDLKGSNNFNTGVTLPSMNNNFRGNKGTSRLSNFKTGSPSEPSSTFGENTNDIQDNNAFDSNTASQISNSINAINTGNAAFNNAFSEQENSLTNRGSFGSEDFAAIPGSPGNDYPILASVPKTSFSCSAHEFPGYYADIETRCQVFHICANGLKYDFICPNGTIFSQMHFVCVWWNQFDCSNAESLYYLNKNIYDYSKVPVSSIELQRGPQGSSAIFGPQGPSAIFGSITGPQGPSAIYDSQTGPKGPSATYGSQTGPQGPSATFRSQTEPEGTSAIFGSQTGPQGPSATYGSQTGPEGPSAIYDSQTGPQGPSTIFGSLTGPQGPSAIYDSQTGSQGPSATYGSQKGPQGPSATFRSQTGPQVPSATYSSQTGPQGPSATYSSQTGRQSPLATYSSQTGPQGSSPIYGPQRPSVTFGSQTRPQSLFATYGAQIEPQGPSVNFRMQTGPQGTFNFLEPQSKEQGPSLAYGLQTSQQDASPTFEQQTPPTNFRLQSGSKSLPGSSLLQSNSEFPLSNGLQEQSINFKSPSSPQASLQSSSVNYISPNTQITTATFGGPTDQISLYKYSASSASVEPSSNFKSNGDSQRPSTTYLPSQQQSKYYNIQQPAYFTNSDNFNTSPLSSRPPNLNSSYPVTGYTNGVPPQSYSSVFQSTTIQSDLYTTDTSAPSNMYGSEPGSTTGIGVSDSSFANYEQTERPNSSFSSSKQASKPNREYLPPYRKRR